MNRLAKVLVFIVAIGLFPGVAGATWFANTETGVVFSGYNDAQIPGDVGTRFSFVDDLRTAPHPYFRLRVGKTIARRHTIAALYAPLTLYADGEFDRATRFDEKTYPPDTSLRGTFRFDSYRLTYRYDFYLSEKLEIGAGLTAKIRDAEIALGSYGYTNTGFVPLVNLRLKWRFADSWGLLLEGDGLVGPQGRAEDFLLAFEADLNEHVAVNFGYRILEGGADNDKVYTFSLLHYGALGVTARF
ncbi:MAG: hypothetical protein P9L99_09000 [Candidatus Lernaella stagnicola]|nr:hypothetical protein [Candidatus Lernaella stagnicola]